MITKKLKGGTNPRKAGRSAKRFRAEKDERIIVQIGDAAPQEFIVEDFARLGRGQIKLTPVIPQSNSSLVAASPLSRVQVIGPIQGHLEARPTPCITNNMYKNLNLGALGHGGVPFDVACGLAKQYNFAGIDLDLGYLGNLAKTTSLQNAKDWFAATGLRPGAIGLNLAWRESDSDRAYVDSLGKFVEDIKLAAEFGCTRCFTWVMPRSDQHDFYHHFDLIFPRLKRAVDLLGLYGIMFGMEFIGPNTLRIGQKFDFVHTMDGMRMFAAALGVDAKNTGILLDLYHWWTAHGTVTELEHLTADEIIYVHLNDAPKGRSEDEQIDQEREMVGATGVLPIKPFLDALRKIGYDGPLTVEPFNAGIKAMSPQNAAAVTSAALDKVLKM